MGLPNNMNNRERALITLEYKKILEKSLDIEIIMMDESLTSVISNSILMETDLSRKKRNKKVDSVANPNDLKYVKELNDWNNKYNTRCSTGIQVGPICNPSIETIKAVFHPNNHNYYYFVNDCEGKLYLSENETLHVNTYYK